MPFFQLRHFCGCKLWRHSNIAHHSFECFPAASFAPRKHSPHNAAHKPVRLPRNVRSVPDLTSLCTRNGIVLEHPLFSASHYCLFAVDNFHALPVKGLFCCVACKPSHYHVCCV